MANNFTTKTDVAEEILIDFQNEGVIANTTWRDYEERIIGDGWDLGGVLDIPLPNKYIVNDGAVISSVPDINEQKTQLELTFRKNIPMKFSTQEMTTSSRFDFKKRFITPAVQQLSAQVEKDLADQMFLHTYHVSGTAGVCPQAYASAALLRARMNNMMVPRADRFLGFSEECYANMISAGTLQNSFDVNLTRDINREAELGRIAQFASYSSPLLASHIAGVGDDTATPSAGLVSAGTVKTTVTSGASITITGLTALSTGVFEPGDKLVFSGVFFVDPLTRKTTNELFSITIVDPSSIDADGSGDAVITVEPNIVSAATSPFRNISDTTGLQAGTIVNLVTANTGVASATKVAYTMNFGYIAQGVIFAAPPLAMPDGIPTKDIGRVVDPDTKTSVRIYSFTDGLNDTSTHRLDLLYGIKIEGDRIFGLLG